MKAKLFSLKVGPDHLFTGRHNLVLSTYTLKKNYFLLFFKRFYLFLLLQRGKWKEKEGEKHQCVVVSRASPIGDMACNPGMCPDWELNL